MIWLSLPGTHGSLRAHDSLFGSCLRLTRPLPSVLVTASVRFPFTLVRNTLYDVNSLIVGSPNVTLISMLAINDQGQMVAESATDAYLLTPYGVPESGTLTTALLGLSLTVVPCGLRRQHRINAISIRKGE